MYLHPDSPTSSSQDEPVSPTPLPAKAVNAPVFVPKSIASPIPQPFIPALGSPPIPPEYGQDIQEYDRFPEYNYYDGQIPVHDYTNHYEPQFFPPLPTFVRQPLNYHLYTTSIPPPFTKNTIDTHFVPNSTALRKLLQSRSEATFSGSTNDLELPDELQGYHSLSPLESADTPDLPKRKFGNWQSTVYKAVNARDGKAYILRRIENYRLMHQSSFSIIELWSHLRHPSIVSIVEAFTTHAFGDSSLVVVYTYHPGAQTLMAAHFSPPVHRPGSILLANTTPQPLPERTAWSYIIQIASAMKRVHESGLAVRTIDVSKVIVTGRNRIRISACGLIDVIMQDQSQTMRQPPQDIVSLQLDDYAMFGRLVFALTCGPHHLQAGGAIANFQKNIENMSRLYGPDMKNLALYLVSKGPHKNFGQVFDIIGTARLVSDWDDGLSGIDALEEELMGELENARLVRLLCKLGFMNERPGEPRWSETGDKYIIKLFRDYVFHQVDEAGNPILSLTHILTSLNKLDAGSDEKIMLTARDEQSCLVVSFKEIKAAMESAFRELAEPTNHRSGYQR